MIYPELPGADHLVSVLLLAFAFDILIGEPPEVIHPVVWIGKLIGMLKRSAPSSHRRVYGTFMALVCILFASLLGYSVLVITNIDTIPETFRLLLAAYFLKSTFAVRSLLAPAQQISNDLIQNRLKEVRERLPIYVSRDPSKLKKEQMSSAVIESVAENFVDGVLSPIFYYSLLGPFGLVGAYAYKAVNTLDSMVGYKDEIHLELGYFSARSDDVLNWIPGRISVLFIAAASVIMGIIAGKNGKKVSCAGALKCAIKDGANTPSPNSGYPMAAVSGALGIRLEKPNTYVLGVKYPQPKPTDIKRASNLIRTAAFLSIAVFSAVIYMIN
ncbi:MAG: cobalamin biosynthesis protein [Methanosarcinaceae archaeon]|nr:cobalamin biosynthesis protein [Methanosarcinaceae archaeon]